ncbi:unnamed protein product [Staurois parvus]|uniref:Uncharacterized protein n=1 Tax=Staurois parvus TaxID=386267 RepID=A0ABN9FQN0_9NEOB|nr:unnamed protein product [Staurois parvus]
MGPPGNRGSWGRCVLAQTQKSLWKKKGTRGTSWGPLLTPGPLAVPEFQMVSPPLVLSNPLCCDSNK